MFQLLPLSPNSFTSVYTVITKAIPITIIVIFMYLTTMFYRFRSHILPFSLNHSSMNLSRSSLCPQKYLQYDLLLVKGQNTTHVCLLYQLRSNVHHIFGKQVFYSWVRSHFFTKKAITIYSIIYFFTFFSFIFASQLTLLLLLGIMTFETTTIKRASFV